MDKDERIDKFPSNCNDYLSKSTATIVEFNCTGTLLAIGCKMGVTLIMDMLHRRIVKCLSYFPELHIGDQIFHGFDEFEEFELPVLLKSLKSNKNISRSKIGLKGRQTGIRVKDYNCEIDSIKFSNDSKKLLIVYHFKTPPKINDENNPNPDIYSPRDQDSSQEQEQEERGARCHSLKNLSTLKSVLVEWDVLEGKISHNFKHDRKITNAQYLPENPSCIIMGGSLPYILRDWTTLELLATPLNVENNSEDASKQGSQERIDFDIFSSNPKEENWLIEPLVYQGNTVFVIYSKQLNVLAFVKPENLNLPKETSGAQKKPSVAIVGDKRNLNVINPDLLEVIKATGSQEESESDNAKIKTEEAKDSDVEMEPDHKQTDFGVFEKLFSEKSKLEESKFSSLSSKILTYHKLKTEITSLRVYHQCEVTSKEEEKEKETIVFVIATCADKTIKLYDFSVPNLGQTKPLRTFHDVVLKRKFAGAMIYNCEDTDLYLIAGVEKAGELMAYSIKGGSQDARVGNFKEGCEYMTYFSNDMRNFMVAYVTSMSSVVIWSKHAIKNFEALSPNFTLIEKNERYDPEVNMEAAEQKSTNDIVWVEPVSLRNLKSCFDPASVQTDIKNIPAKLTLDDNVTEFCRNKIVNF
ncbi:unnamed protein product [Moneuplotes crassus]|uniref:Uncharacterized protein n=1 Tax=Euplotes crassus TaxID=5936 RepID=A0AAD1U3N6_EUPCR|nr:unnamed protein product [Moneuplotes crassus]